MKNKNKNLILSMFICLFLCSCGCFGFNNQVDIINETKETSITEMQINDVVREIMMSDIENKIKNLPPKQTIIYRVFRKCGQ